jgi:hypothetical protein
MSIIENREAQLRQIARWFELGADHTIEQYTQAYFANEGVSETETTLTGEEPEILGGIAYFAIRSALRRGNLSLALRWLRCSGVESALREIEWYWQICLLIALKEASPERSSFWRARAIEDVRSRGDDERLNHLMRQIA